VLSLELDLLEEKKRDAGERPRHVFQGKANGVSPPIAKPYQPRFGIFCSILNKTAD
jgi:hypothetical protein